MSRRLASRLPAGSVPSHTSSFAADILWGLRRQPKRLPCKYFYDQRGSELFEQICELDEYYLTRTELAIMQQYASEMGELIGPRSMLVEYGSGSSTKTRLLLSCLSEPAAYVPVDISSEHLHGTARKLARDFPGLEILPVDADFTKDFVLPAPHNPVQRTVVYFPGSTVGNFLRAEVRVLLRRITKLAGDNGGLLIGIDLKKDIPTIEAAYNDSLGVTDQFNLNLLRRINHELGADFDLDKFQHLAYYSESMGRMEIYLVSRCDQRVTIAGEPIQFAADERICTEYSHKYTIAEFKTLAAGAGLVFEHAWTDPGQNFGVMYFKASRPRIRSRRRLAK